MFTISSTYSELGMVIHAFNLTTWDEEVSVSCEFTTSLIYIVSSRAASAIETLSRINEQMNK